MRPLLFFPLLLLPTLAAPPLAAQGGGLTVREALALAHARNPRLAAAGASRMVAQGRARTDGAFPNPIAEWRRENLRSDIQPDIFAEVAVPLDLTGRRFALRDAGAAAVARGRADSAAIVRDVEGEVVRAYWNAALGEELVALASAERAAREEIATFDAQRFAEGAVAEVAAIRTRLEADRARMSEAQARGDAARLRAALARTLGLTLDSLPAVARITALETLPGVPEEQAAWAQALATRPDLAALRHAAAEAERRAVAERRGVISDLQFVTGYKKTTGVNTGVLGVTLPLPLFHRNDGPRERARGERLIADAEQRDAELRARGEVAAAVHAYAALRATIDAGAADVESRATEVAQIAEGAYREGALSLMELIEAQRARADARAAALRWNVDIRLTLLELNRAIGAPIVETP